jgi:hypothetical protein
LAADNQGDWLFDLSQSRAASSAVLEVGLNAQYRVAQLLLSTGEAPKALRDGANGGGILAGAIEGGVEALMARAISALNTDIDARPVHNARCWQDYFYATVQTPGSLSAMPRVRIGPALPDREQLDVEITRLRDLDVGELREPLRMLH